MGDYVSFLRQLSAYRKREGRSQEEMAALFGIHQTHYARAEDGTRSISFDALKAFLRNGGDLYQLFTGRVTEENFVGMYFDLCKTKAGKQKLFSMYVWGLDLFLWEGEKSNNGMANALKKCIRLLDGEKKKITLWRNIRDQEGYTQETMAAILDIEVKRYRRIEKGKVAADAEILNRLYQKLHYLPQIFFDRDNYYVDELNYYWNCLDDISKAKANQILEMTIREIQEREALCRI